MCFSEFVLHVEIESIWGENQYLSERTKVFITCNALRKIHPALVIGFMSLMRRIHLLATTSAY